MASDRRVFLIHIVAEATCLAMKIGCFRRTGCLLTRHSSEKDNEIKPQGVISKIVVPVNNNIFTVPSEQVMPE